MIEPAREAEVAEAVRDARGPLRIRGGGTRGGDGEGEVLSLAGLTGIALHEPGALTLVAAAGTPMAEVEAALAAHGQRLAFEPMDHRGLLGTSGVPTIGGAVSVAASGPRRVQAGGCRDHLLGVRFVDGTGAAIKNGGRVMKNVTGYDLVKLLCGARGTLGVLTEVALKVLPAPPASASLTIDGLDAGRAVAAMTAALGSPFEVTGAAWDGTAARLRIEGLEGSVAYRAGRLAELLAPFGTVEVARDPAANAARWAAIRDVAPFHGRAGDVWRVALRPSDAPAAAAAAGGEALLDLGGAAMWVLLPEGTDLRGRLGRVRHVATPVRGAAPRVAARPAPIAAIEAGLRARFDPRGILSPGMAA